MHSRLFRYPLRAGAFALALAMTAPLAARAGDFDDNGWDRPQKGGGAELVFGFSGNSFSTGETACDAYYYYYCTTTQQFDIKSVAAPRFSLHLFPLRHFQINVDVDHIEPRTTIFADVYDPVSGNTYTQETDLGKLELTRVGVSAFYRVPTRNLDFYLGGGLEIPLQKSFTTDVAWRCQDATCTQSDRIDANVSTGFRIAVGVDIKLSKTLWFNIEGVGKSYDTDFTFHDVGTVPTGNNNLKFSDRVTEGVLLFGLGVRF